MDKFVVYVKEVYTVAVEVEAKSLSDARSKVVDMLAEGIDAEPNYEFTMDSDEWFVEKV